MLANIIADRIPGHDTQNLNLSPNHAGQQHMSIKFAPNLIKLCTGKIDSYCIKSIMVMCSKIKLKFFVAIQIYLFA